MNWSDIIVKVENKVALKLFKAMRNGNRLNRANKHYVISVIMQQIVL